MIELRFRLRKPFPGKNRIDGAVLALFDLEPARRQAAEAQQALGVLQEMLELMDQPAVVVGEDFRIVYHNPVFAEKFRHDGAGESIYRVMDGHVDVDRLRAMLEQELPRDGRVDRFEVGKGDGQRPMQGSVRRLGRDGTETAALVLTFSKL